MSDISCFSSSVPAVVQTIVETEAKVEKKEEMKQIVAGPLELSDKMMRLRLAANDGTIVEVDQEVAFKSRLIRDMMENLGLMDSPEIPCEPLPVSNVTGKTLEKILEYCKEKKNEEYTPKDEKDDPRINLSQWDKEYLEVPSEQLVDILLGANYLDIPGIIDITTQKIANMADGKSVEQLRDMFELQNDFSPDEESEVQQRFAWVEQ